MLELNLRKPTQKYFLAIGKALGKLGLHPNVYTLLTLITGIGVAYTIYINEIPLAIALLLLSGLMDALDGAVAKANNQVTKFGGMFDSVTDKITECLIYLGLAMYNPLLYFSSFLAIMGFMVSSYISQRGGTLGVKTSGGLMKRQERIFLLLIGLGLIAFVPAGIQGVSALRIMDFILYVIAIGTAYTGAQRMLRAYNTLRR
jgi:phosphatidylglycerophosphate synthase